MFKWLTINRLHAFSVSLEKGTDDDVESTGK